MGKYCIKHKSGWKVGLYSEELEYAKQEATAHARATTYTDSLELIEVDADTVIAFKADSDSDWESKHE